MQRLRPNLFVIGAMKSGTTSLHAYLGSHPQIFMCPEKEPSFFAKETISSRGEDWYLKLFAAAGSKPVIGESSTAYSRIPLFPGVPERIALLVGRGGDGGGGLELQGRGLEVAGVEEGQAVLDLGLLAFLWELGGVGVDGTQGTTPLARNAGRGEARARPP